MKKGLIISTILLFFAASFSSCLKRGLDDLPAFTDANIDRFDFEFRWDDNGAFRVVRFNTDVPVVNGKSLSVTTTVPAAGGTFTEEVRNSITAANIVGMCNISTAATIVPGSNAPELGVPGDFSQPVNYEVIAADGTTKSNWTLTVTLVK